MGGKKGWCRPMLDMIKCSGKNLMRKKMRSMLTIIGIAIGVASVILIGNIAECGTTAVSTELDSLGMGGVSITASATVPDATLSAQELEQIREQKSVDQAAPLMTQTTQVYGRGNVEESLVWGIDTKANQVVSLQVEYGRFFSNVDISSGANVCMVDQKFAQKVYNRDNIVGKKINILCGGSMEEFLVVGVLKTGSGLLQNFIGDYIPNFVYVPYTTLQNAVGLQRFDQVVVRVKDGYDEDEAGEEIAAMLGKTSGISEGYLSSNLAKQKDGLNNLLGIVTLVLSAVGAISLLVASLSIMTVMLVSVNERTREIGIKKSIGAKRATILFEFMTEAVLLSLIGCMVGVIIGTGVSYLGAYALSMELKMRMDIILTAVLFSLLSGVVFGVYPAFKASNLRPVDALRQE